MNFIGPRPRKYSDIRIANIKEERVRVVPTRKNSALEFSFSAQSLSKEEAFLNPSATQEATK